MDIDDYGGEAESLTISPERKVQFEASPSHSEEKVSDLSQVNIDIVGS